MKRSILVRLFVPLVTTAILLGCAFNAAAQKGKREFYELRMYHYSGAENESRLDAYFKDALVPALHRAGIKNVGVFKMIDDTASKKKMYVLIPYPSLDYLDKIHDILDKDKKYQEAGAEYINAAHNNAPYTRIENVVMKAFSGAPVLQKSKLTGDKKSRVYELRSYEGATEKLYRTKVKMFNTGDEVGLFNRLGFNAIFYAEVLAGSKMPNLMYMTTFENMASRDAHWKAFGEDEQWKKLKSDKQYDNTVSHIDIFYLYPTAYSDL